MGGRLRIRESISEAREAWGRVRSYKLFAGKSHLRSAGDDIVPENQTGVISFLQAWIHVATGNRCHHVSIKILEELRFALSHYITNTRCSHQQVEDPCVFESPRYLSGPVSTRASV